MSYHRHKLARQTILEKNTRFHFDLWSVRWAFAPTFAGMGGHINSHLSLQKMVWCPQSQETVLKHNFDEYAKHWPNIN